MTLAERDTVPFTDVEQLRGAWLPLSSLQRVVETGLPNLQAAIDRDQVRLIADILLGAADREPAGERVKGFPFPNRCEWIPAILVDLVVFDHFFVDATAAERRHVSRASLKGLGLLADDILFVRPDEDVYAAAVKSTEIFLANLPPHLRQLKYLEEHDPSDPDRYWRYFDSEYKDAADEFFASGRSGPLHFPARFVDTNGSIERAMSYMQIQRMSGAPVRLNPARLETLSVLNKFLPVSIRSAVRDSNPQGAIEGFVSGELFDHIEVDAPPIFELIVRRMENAPRAVSFLDVIQELRQDRTVHRHHARGHRRGPAGRGPALVRAVRCALCGAGCGEVVAAPSRGALDQRFGDHPQRPRRLIPRRDSEPRACAAPAHRAPGPRP
jgi:hypothetical protein